jgi:DNA-binding transcriptional ArsR family regulator
MATTRSSKTGDLFIALAHPLRRRILRKMIEDETEISPRELALDLREHLSRLSYHVRILAWCDAIELARMEQVRGSTQMALEATGDPPEKAKP